MITSLRLRNFKNFVDETLRVGPFTVIVGANASGKSNIRDAFRFLHGVGRGYTLADTTGGKYVGGHLEWKPIRGANNEIVRLGRDTLHISATARLADASHAAYHIGVRLEEEIGFRVDSEDFEIGNRRIYTTHPIAPDSIHSKDDESHLLLRMEKTGSQKKDGCRVAIRSDQPALTQLRSVKRVIREHKDRASEIANLFSQWRFLDPSPRLMREPAFPGKTILGDHGENLPTVIRKLCADERMRQALFGWIRALTPMDVAGFDFPVYPDGRVHFAICERRGRKISSRSASDGTLRFLALLAALLDETSAGLYFFEEIDSGIHPSRLHLLVDLIERQTRKGNVQVVTTTHSPELLNIVNDDTFGDISVVCRSEDTEDSVIRPIAGLPNIRALRREQGLGRLLAGDWMETVISFTESRVNDGGDPV